VITAAAINAALLMVRIIFRSSLMGTVFGFVSVVVVVVVVVVDVADVPAHKSAPAVASPPIKVRANK
jgi:hypothetical protein